MTDEELQAIRERKGLTDPKELALWAEQRNCSKGEFAALIAEVERLRALVETALATATPGTDEFRAAFPPGPWGGLTACAKIREAITGIAAHHSVSTRAPAASRSAQS